jgi:predicted metal-binding protein
MTRRGSSDRLNSSPVEPDPQRAAEKRHLKGKVVTNSRMKGGKRTAGIRNFLQRFNQHGAIRAEIISPSDVATASWVRWKCQFGCGGYGSTLMCPPHAPAPEETRKMLDEYRTGILFEGTYGNTKKIAVRMEREIFLSGFQKALGLGAGPCRLCPSCAMGEGCRNPDRARPSMEACGIDVFTTVRKHGFSIEVVKTRDDPQHYFGLVLID